jgi:hypothetical protein
MMEALEVLLRQCSITAEIHDWRRRPSFGLAASHAFPATASSAVH